MHCNVTFRRFFQTFFSGKAIIITYCERVFVALPIQHVPSMHHVVVLGPPDYTIFFHLIS